MACPGRALPADFIQITLDVHGEAGVEWLARLPRLMAECAERWSLTVASPFVPLTYNYVAPATRADGTSVVLKAGVPGRGLRMEIEALRLFEGRGAVRLLDADAERGVLLLERLTPGASLATVADDAQATEIAAGVMRHLWRPAPDGHPFPNVADWLRGFERLRRRFDGGSGPLPPRLVEEAEATAKDLLGSSPKTALLHGDLHNGNILTSERAPWLAIDPQGVVGESAFEVGAFLLNPGPQTVDVLDLRIAIFADALAVTRERIRGWGLVRAVLSAWWSVEDHGAGWEDAVAVAVCLSDQRR